MATPGNESGFATRLRQLRPRYWRALSASRPAPIGGLEWPHRECFWPQIVSKPANREVEVCRGIERKFTAIEPLERFLHQHQRCGGIRPPAEFCRTHPHHPELAMS